MFICNSFFYKGRFPDTRAQENNQRVDHCLRQQLRLRSQRRPYAQGRNVIDVSVCVCVWLGVCLYYEERRKNDSILLIHFRFDFRNSFVYTYIYNSAKS